MERTVGSKQDILLGNRVVSSPTLEEQFPHHSSCWNPLIHLLHPMEEEHATGHCSVFQPVDGLQRTNPVIPLEYRLTARKFRRKKSLKQLEKGANGMNTQCLPALDAIQCVPKNKSTEEY